jgi:parallel beta-helix repeat protein
MRRQIKLLVILFALVFSSFNVAGRVLLPVAKATYVEGPIINDTDWTLVDSPFVVSNDTLVYANATLTIEPGVEVRFGEHFSLVIEGKLIANGAMDKMIKFTSNRYTPAVGDWETIRFNSVETSSLTYAILEYGRNEFTIDNGQLNIQNCWVRFSSENGIKVTNGNVMVRNNDIANNTCSGVHVSGGMVTLSDNAISSNRDGIVLTGATSSEIDIEGNTITGNSYSGILLEADNYTNTVVQNNVLSSNNNGFYVSTSASTYITRNYILNNTIGIYYETGTSHEAHFNDICGNQFGMNASIGAGVSATYNYWGSRSGPYHESLNPRGKGDTVSGDRTDFLFYLSDHIDYENAAPTAILWADKTLVAPNQNVTFIAADSYDDGRVDQYLFDFGDGNSSTWTTLSLLNYTYATPIDYTHTYSASLKIIDDFNVTNNNVATTEITVVEGLTPLSVAVTLGSENIEHGGNVSVSVYVSNQIGPVENAEITLFSLKGGIFSVPSGLTNAVGYFDTVFTAPDVTEISNLRIIARASVFGYADGSDYEYLRVLPPLNVQVAPDPDLIQSEGQTNINVHVTVGSDEPVPDASLTLSCSSGTLSETNCTTDADGNAIITFAASRTLSQIEAIVSVVATKPEYAMGQGQTTIVVKPKELLVELSSDPAAIISETTSAIKVHVTSNGAPVANAGVSITSNVGGSFSATSGTTGLDGNATFTLYAPQVTNPEGIIGTISAMASKDGYVEGQGQTTVALLPKILSLQLYPSTSSTVSEAAFNVTAHVAYFYDMSPVFEANVTITSADSNLLSATGLTDSQGDVTLSFTAPAVDQPTNITMKAHATKAGYVDAEETLIFAADPGIIDVEFKTDSYVVPSGESMVVEVYATCNSTPVANASVIVSTNLGNFTPTIGQTDQSGRCNFTYDSPETATQLTIVASANVSKYGYISGSNTTTINVAPQMPAEGGGFPWLMLLLIIIPVVIVVVVVVLIKLKVIVISADEEDAS